MKQIVFILAMVILSNICPAQIPSWDNTVLNEISDSRMLKYLNNGSMAIDDNNFVHLAFLRQRTGAGALERELYYALRDHRGEWSHPELINIAGYRFNKPNILINPHNSNIEIYGTINTLLNRVVNDGENGWRLEQPGNNLNNMFETNAVYDSRGNVHIAGVNYNDNRQLDLIYTTNRNGEWSSEIIHQASLTFNPQSVSLVIDVCERGRVVIGYVGRDVISIVQNSDPGINQWQIHTPDTPNNSNHYFDLAFIDDYIHIVIAGQGGGAMTWRQYYLRKNFEAEVWREAIFVSSNRSLINPSLTKDRYGFIHIIAAEATGTEVSGDLYYMTDANPDGEWTITNPFEEISWRSPLVKIDKRDNFQLAAIIHSDNNNQEIIVKGASWQAILPFPRNLRAGIDDSDVILNWDRIELPDFPPLPDFLGYNIYRKGLHDDEYLLINEEPVSDPTYADLDIITGVYEYYVTASFADDESESSNAVEAAILPVPYNLSASAALFDINLQWSDLAIPDDTNMPDFISYNIYRKIGDEGVFTRINEDVIITDTTYIDPGLNPQVYSYYITAFFAGNYESNSSDTVRTVVVERLSQPQFNPPAGRFDHVVNLTIGSPDEIGNIYYTLNGDDPDEESDVFDDLLLLTETTTVKAIIFHPDFNPSEIVAGEYIIDMTSVDDNEVDHQRETNLFPAYPNPFNPKTIISWRLAQAGEVKLTVYDVRGNLVCTLIDGHKTAGTHQTTFTADELPSGIYFYKLQTAETAEIRKMLLLK